ncbi:MAG: nuclear transport factor 2 family protein [Pseudomonadota bacterium]
MRISILGAIALSMLLTGCAKSDAGHHESEAAAAVDPAAATLKVAQSFLMAAGSGDMETLSGLMTDDFVWHNEGDKNVPWIGTWEGKETVLNEFLPTFGGGLKTTKWTTDFSFANGDQAVFMGTMAADAINTGKSTGDMSWAVRVHVVDGMVKSWNWFEDSYAVSQAYTDD